MRRHTQLGLGFALAVCLFSNLCAADVIWGTVTHTLPTGLTGEQAVLLTPGTLGTSLGGSTFVIQGTTSTGGVVNIFTNNAGSSGTDQLFANTSTQLLANPLGSSDTSIDELTFTFGPCGRRESRFAVGSRLIVGTPCTTYTDILMNLQGVFDTSDNGAGADSVAFLVTTNDGSFVHIFTGLTANNTDNFILISTANGENITSVSLADTRFYSLEGLSVSTPEPASLMLIGTGLLSLASLRPKRRR